MELKHYKVYRAISLVLIVFCLVGAFVSSLLKPTFGEDLRLSFELGAFLATVVVVGLCNHFSSHPNFVRPLFHIYEFEEKIAYSFLIWLLLLLVDLFTKWGGFAFSLPSALIAIYLWYRIWKYLKILIFEARLKSPIYLHETRLHELADNNFYEEEE